MAKSRKRSFRRKRMKADWVYRGNSFDGAGGLVDGFGTYQGNPFVITAGIAGAVGRILYDSHNSQAMWGTSLANVPFAGPPAASRAEGAPARILRVQGSLNFNPSTWALGSTFTLGIRFGMFEQDPASRALLIDPNYHMLNVTTSTMLSPATWANDRQWQHERRLAIAFNDNSQLFNMRFDFRVNRRLQPNFAYAMYIETIAGSVTLNMRTFLRTLVADEGA